MDKDVVHDTANYYSGIERERMPRAASWMDLEIIMLLPLLLLLSRFSRVRLCATPQTAAHQAPPSLGFSRQEHWSGLPFPSPIHESEVAQSCPTLSDPMDCSLPGSSIHGIFQARVLEWGATAFSGHTCAMLENKPELTQYNKKKKQDVTTKCYRKICHYFQVKSSCSKKTVVMKTIIILSNSEKAMAPHSSTLAWKTPWMEEPGRL